MEPLEERTLLAAGDLDPTFGTDGKVTTDFVGSGGDDQGQDVVVVQADGKIVVAGYSEQGGAGYCQQPVTGYNFALARYHTDGTLDASFGGDGKVTTDFGSYLDYGRSVAIDAAGNIVVAGYSSQAGTGYDFALARYHTDGTLDAAFGGNSLPARSWWRELPARASLGKTSLWRAIWASILG